MSGMETGWPEGIIPPDAQQRSSSLLGLVLGPICRGCGQPLSRENVFCDLGAQPLANGLLTESQLAEPEVHYPVRPLVCSRCLLVQLPATPPPDTIFTDNYPFFAGQSVEWMAHCKRFAKSAIERFGLGPTSRVLDIGSNDGTMLRPFRGLGIPCLGVEPSEGVAQHALMEGLPTVIDWWGVECAERLSHTQGLPTGKNWKADLVVCTNVLAHVPDLRDFLGGVREILAPGGVAAFELPYIGNLINECQYDQIYVEHHSYFSLGSLNWALRIAGLGMTDVEWLGTHGGSMRVYATTEAREDQTEGKALEELKAEIDQDLGSADAYLRFAEGPLRVKQWALSQLFERSGKRVVGYGASAKAAVTLNFLGLDSSWIEFVADTTPAKWGKYLPGCRIPIRTPQQLAEARPDVVVLLAWNWAREAVPRIQEACPDAEIIMLAPAVSEAALLETTHEQDHALQADHPDGS